MANREDQPNEVLIVHHPTTNAVRPLRYAAMGLLSLAEYLSRHGIRAQVVNLAIEQRVDPGFDIVEYAERCGARIIGVSVHWFFQLRDCIAMVRQIKARAPGIAVVLGGFSASYFAHDLMKRCPEIDAIVRGDGEEPFLAYCAGHLGRDQQLRLEAIPNLVYCDKPGSVRANPFTHVASSEQLDSYRFADLDLLKNHEGLHDLAQGPSNRFRRRFDFDGNGIFLLEVGRGCCYSCSLCGGNWKAQRVVSNRKRPTLRSVDAVLRTIKKAHAFGHRNIYVSFDPDPSAAFYLRLFERIRSEKIQVRFMFESWGLTPSALLEGMARTFTDSMIVLTADTADERIRAVHKGPLAYTNQQLESVLARAQELGIAAQVFFGFFLPGDDRGSMMRTRRYAADLQERFDCETLYMDFSTDPGSPVGTDPEAFEMEVDLRSLDDYLEALARPRLSPNMVGHRPTSMTAKEATLLITAMNLDQFVQKMLPGTLRFMFSRWDERRQEVHAVYERFLLNYAERHGDPLVPFSVQDLCQRLTQHLGGASSLFGKLTPALCELVTFESVPYVLKSRQVGHVEVHYSDLCREAEVSLAERRSTLSAGSAVEQRVSII